jgi:phosphoglycolate phosphatase-like HAD superfamily hydrolase
MAIDISRIRALCFDVDGTLIDTDNLAVHKLARLLRPVKFLFPHKNPHPFARRLVMFTETPGNMFFGLADRLRINRLLVHLGNFTYRLGLHGKPASSVLVPGVRRMLGLVGPRYPLSIITARNERTVRQFLENHDLTGSFKCVAHAMTCRHTKPFPDPVLWVAAQMGVSPEQCLVIGDTTLDICSGKSAGAQTVGVLCGFGEEDELRRAGADLILPSTANLAEVLIR